MQFFKYDGIIANGSCSEENNDVRSMSEIVREIEMKSEAFNNALHGSGYFYVEDISRDKVSIGIICRDAHGLENQIKEYLEAIEFELKYTNLEEITFDTCCHMLHRASRKDYIDDNDDVLEKFELDRIDGNFVSGIEYGENIIESLNKKTVYEDAERFLAGDSFIPELDRIYSFTPKCRVNGHPVHYFIQTDDRETRKGMCRTLLAALSANGRLRSRRYVFLDFKPGDHFSVSAYSYLYKSCAGGTVVVRYQAGDDAEDDLATGERDTIEKLCEIMKKYRSQVLTIFCLPRECTNSKDIFYENLGNISFVELKEEFISGERAESFLKKLAKDNGVRADKKLFSMLEEDKGYLAPDLREIFDEWYNSKLKTSIFPQYKEIAGVRKEVLKAAPKGSAYDELMKMIGLSEVKTVINRALNYFKAQKLFADNGLKTDRPAMHMVFTGNPGTAKTTVARLFASIMRKNGILSKGKLIEVGRGDLVGKYVGWTAPTIKKKFKDAQGSVLFIDEAYSLVDDRDGSFGDEAINTIVQEMENHRDDVIVIFAGYPDKMEAFLQKNPGLRSRIAFHVPFADYNTEELCGIAGLIAEKKGLVLTEGANERLASIFDEARTQSDFGNGRYVRNIIEQARMAQADRLIAMDFESIDKKDIVTICAEDIEPPAAPQNNQKNKIGFCA